jgi:hypothetical protein
MKKYKVVEKTSLDSYGDEKKKYYIKKRFLFFWTYVVAYEEDFSFQIPIILLSGLIGIVSCILFSFILIPLVPFIGIYHLFIAYPAIMIWSQHLMKCLQKDDFYSLKDAQDKLKVLIKKQSFQNKTVEVLEVSVGSDKITFEKK